MEDNKKKYRDMNEYSSSDRLYSLMLSLKNDIELLNMQIRTLKNKTEGTEQN